ncbi:hypothetical protein EVAR_77768_1 [Eumeta japonica]|uniref:Uncharacterized protein n=1 Tax=Eumeta variegata TaxID=151549 RepID=A0A4C1TAZ7_EUMVA|nr:hypothetical protein EVAR_77768_1 [Eumeta japonica]
MRSKIVRTPGSACRVILKLSHNRLGQRASSSDSGRHRGKSAVAAATQGFYARASTPTRSIPPRVSLRSPTVIRPAASPTSSELVLGETRRRPPLVRAPEPRERALRIAGDRPATATTHHLNVADGGNTAHEQVNVYYCGAICRQSHQDTKPFGIFEQSKSGPLLGHPGASAPAAPVRRATLAQRAGSPLFLSQFN